MAYEILDHTADLAFKVRAKNLEELFEESGRALFTEILGNLSRVKPQDKDEVTIEAESVEDLLVEWLNELLFRFDARGRVYSNFDVHIHDTGLKAIVFGEKINLRRHKVKIGIKAVTYHMLSIRKLPLGYEATFLADI